MPSTEPTQKGRRNRRIVPILLLLAAALVIAGLVVNRPSNSASANDGDTNTASALSDAAGDDAEHDVDDCDNADSAADCLTDEFATTNGTPEEEAHEADMVDTAYQAETVAQSEGYTLQNTTCLDACVLQGGLEGDTPEEKAVNLLAKGVMSPPILDGLARSIVDQQGGTYTDTRPVGDMHKAASDLAIFLDFVHGSTVSEGVMPAGTTLWNSVVQDGHIVQFRYTTTKDRAYLQFSKGEVKITLFDTCGNPMSTEEQIPNVPVVPEPAHDDKVPPTTTTVPPTTVPPTTTPPTTVCTGNTHPENGGCVHNSVEDPDYPTPRRQDPQDNSSGSDISPGPNPEPSPSPTNPPSVGSQPPPPTPGGYDTGSDSPDMPAGGECTGTSCSGGGISVPNEPPTDTGQGGTNDGPIEDPFG